MDADGGVVKWNREPVLKKREQPKTESAFVPLQAHTQLSDFQALETQSTQAKSWDVALANDVVESIPAGPNADC
jgi:hypothetical protein